LDNKLKIYDAGETAVFCRLGEDIDPNTSRKVISLNRLLNEAGIDGIIETVPSYTGIMIYYTPDLCSGDKLKEAILSLYSKNSFDTADSRSYLIEVPVCYGDHYGPDLDYVSTYCGISPDEVIKIHTAPEYRIYMLGFTPGFPYLGGMDKKIATPRKETPRVKIRAGTIGIAGEQTGIYPIDSPGGWQLIGKTPLNLVDFSMEQPFLFEAGDYIKFKSVSLTEYFEIAEALKKGSYKSQKKLIG